jgi:undecaprenyl-diphosphatase
MLNGIDLAILYFVNRSLANSVFDWLFWTVSESWFLLGIAAILSAFLIWNNRKKGWLIVVLAILCVTATDYSTYALKKVFCRPRPCQTLTDLRLIAGCGGKYGFPSNHAANSFGFAFLISFFYRRLKPYLFTLAGLVCLSRIYLGKHYPSDVLAGALWGMAIAFLIFYLAKPIINKLFKTAGLTQYFGQ